MWKNGFFSVHAPSPFNYARFQSFGGEFYNARKASRQDM